MSDELISKLTAFTDAKSFRGKVRFPSRSSSPSTAVSGAPLDPEALVTERQGQVLGLGRESR
jgi:hypothetical protein